MGTVFARLKVPAPDGSGAIDDHGVHAFIVPLRDADNQCFPGVEIKDCGYKVGQTSSRILHEGYTSALVQDKIPLANQCHSLRQKPFQLLCERVALATSLSLQQAAYLTASSPETMNNVHHLVAH